MHVVNFRLDTQSANFEWASTQNMNRARKKNLHNYIGGKKLDQHENQSLITRAWSR